MKMKNTFLRLKKFMFFTLLFTGLLVSCGEPNASENNSTGGQPNANYREISISKGQSLGNYLDVDIVFKYDSAKSRYSEAVIDISSLNPSYDYINAYVKVFFNGITQGGTTSLPESGYKRFTVTCSVHNTGLANQTISITANSNFKIRVPK